MAQDTSPTTAAEVAAARVLPGTPRAGVARNAIGLPQEWQQSKNVFLDAISLNNHNVQTTAMVFQSLINQRLVDLGLAGRPLYDWSTEVVFVDGDADGTSWPGSSPNRSDDAIFGDILDSIRPSAQDMEAGLSAYYTRLNEVSWMKARDELNFTPPYPSATTETDGAPEFTITPMLAPPIQYDPQRLGAQPESPAPTGAGNGLEL